MFPVSCEQSGSTAGQFLAPWPLSVLDVRALRRNGLRPVPVHQFTLKVHSRCNLTCTYCYIYHGRDESWRGHPPQVSTSVMRQTAHRIAEHARAHELSEVRIALHGGEPLLSGPGVLVDYVRTIRTALPADCVLRATVQSNGTLLTEQALTRLAQEGIRVGLSLDGGTPAFNRRRVDHAGRPSWRRAVRAARLLARNPQSYAGILCTVDVTADPGEVYRSLAALRPPMLDLLLPHGNWSNPPPGLPVRAPEAARTGDRGATPYGDWLAAVFDLWWNSRSGEGPPPRIRIFSEIIALLLGLPSTLEAVGLSPTAAIVVETDGEIEQLDSLKQTYEGAVVTGLDVFRNTFDESLDHPGVSARQIGVAALGAVCRTCPVMAVCGGGNYAHRYREGSGFRHPSVYCHDLERLIRHVAAALVLATGGERPVPAVSAWSPTAMP
ncbi:FxsB family radical SAM/SPASM domain protein [Streptomyces sp. ME02-8801-2C]|uniref:FxsB family cyclophane-forming radical SAM/SPASM peptide maturase n=1 Tax=Streptomyces sp. ME02-8801-2C TaxID=3028680 RepID=UPI0029B698E2|nr:FxsB family cyclophane-forming radical SAM/SPASM peptide maturase [Streptomyces sp. ME02-8801-2C]MDX3451038.1 FxsB family radical SAM/SPASM domain protein [Streptomyces sp. ME02-8801-2C]